MKMIMVTEEKDSKEEHKKNIRFKLTFFNMY